MFFTEIQEIFLNNAFTTTPTIIFCPNDFRKLFQMRTLEEALNYLDYHKPNEEQVVQHEKVNFFFQQLMKDLWNDLPEGPGKTVAIRAIGAARMQCNSCIANDGI